jgi:hypothetical protein
MPYIQTNRQIIVQVVYLGVCMCQIDNRLHCCTCPYRETKFTPSSARVALRLVIIDSREGPQRKSSTQYTGTVLFYYFPYEKTCTLDAVAFVLIGWRRYKFCQTTLRGCDTTPHALPLSPLALNQNERCGNFSLTVLL